ncbi:MAG: sugar phosphate nucleotidyltransferase [Geminicoccaceae bacterium]
MKVAILAGGLGSRLSEETRTKSNAMVAIGEQPVLWHIMRYFAHFGMTEFVVALGYQGESIRDYFAGAGFRVTARDDGGWERREAGDWTVELVETGVETQNGGRLKRLAPFLGEGTFILTWCDGLADVDLHQLTAFHRAHGASATLTAVHPPARFGRLMLDEDRIAEFQEKTIDPNEWINGAYFVLEPEVLGRIEGDHTSFERDVLTRLAQDSELMAFRHGSFWQCMDTLREAEVLNAMWNNGRAPWKLWE